MVERFRWPVEDTYSEMGKDVLCERVMCLFHFDSSMEKDIGGLFECLDLKEGLKDAGVNLHVSNKQFELTHMCTYYTG